MILHYPKKARITHHQCKSVHIKWTKNDGGSNSIRERASPSAAWQFVGKTWAVFSVTVYIVYVHWNEHEISFWNKNKLRQNVLWTVQIKFIYGLYLYNEHTGSATRATTQQNFTLCVDKCAPTLATFKLNAKRRRRRRRLILSRWRWRRRRWWWWFIHWPHFLIELNRMEKDEMKPQQCNNGIKLSRSLRVCVRVKADECEASSVYVAMPMPVSICECVWACACACESIQAASTMAPTCEIYHCHSETGKQFLFASNLILYTHTCTHEISFTPAPLLFSPSTLLHSSPMEMIYTKYLKCYLATK